MYFEHKLRWRAACSTQQSVGGQYYVLYLTGASARTGTVRGVAGGRKEASCGL
jgi:hypothetical protein